MTFTDAQKEYDKMYLEHGGKEYGYIEDYVQERLEAYRQAQEALEEAAAAYEDGEIELKEYTAAVSALQYQRQVVNTIQEYQSKLSYADRYGKQPDRKYGWFPTEDMKKFSENTADSVSLF